VDALQAALVRQGRDAEQARPLSEDAVLAIQGAIVLARALDDPAVFQRAIGQFHARLLAKGETDHNQVSASQSP